MPVRSRLSSTMLRKAFTTKTGILMFVSRFPYDAPRGVLALLARAAPYIGALVFGETAYVTLALPGPVPPLPVAVALFQTWIDIVLTILALSALFLEHLQIAIVLEAGVALAFGVWLNTLHSRVDRFVDRVLFRRRHLAEERLQRAARTLAHAESPRFVDETLAMEAADALSLASAAVFRETGTGYERVFARGWSADECGYFDADDRLVVTLRAELQSVALFDLRAGAQRFPAGIANPLLGVPLVVRHHLSGFVFYGGHTGGEAIDADERRVLEHLCEAGAAAYEHLRAAAIISDANALRAENELLRHDTALLRDIAAGRAAAAE